MKVTFRYDREKDVWCLLNKGKSSMNSQKLTKQYEQLIKSYGENVTNEITSNFIDGYLLDKKVDVEKYIDYYQKDLDTIAEEYTRRAEEVFGISIQENMIAYLTINSRCPYNFEENYFYVTVPTYDYIARKTVMHELWHFYTWYGLGTDQIQKIGAQKYNDLKESLTVLLNSECADLFSENTWDTGYPQHQELRQKIVDFWVKDRNIKNLWEYLVNL